MSLIWLVVGLILGGGVSLVFLCALQIGRINEYESEARRLRSELEQTKKA